jgi:hypothetical protein
MRWSSLCISDGSRLDAQKKMAIEESHNSDDGLLNLIVIREDDGDSIIGFHGNKWHTHGDILASVSGLSERDAIRQFIDSILNDEAVIAVLRSNGAVRDVWVTDDIQSELKYKQDNEDFEFRRWSGRPVFAE